MKVCVIGNSHVWALRAAASADNGGLTANGDFDVAFWGAPGPKFHDVRYDGGRLIAPDPKLALHLSGGKHETIAPHEFDALVFHGLALNVTNLLRVLSRQADASSYSLAFLRDGIGAQLDKAPSSLLIRQIRPDYRGRILVSPPPLISEQSNYFGDHGGKPGERAVIDEVLRDYFERHGAGYVPQPENTVVDGRYTAAAYSDRSVRPNGAIEYRHMNKLYGAEVLRAIATKLRG